MCRNSFLLILVLLYELVRNVELHVAGVEWDFVAEFLEANVEQCRAGGVALWNAFCGVLK